MGCRAGAASVRERRARTWPSEQVTTGERVGESVAGPRLPLAEGVPGAAAPAVKALLDEQLLDQMVERVRADGGRLTGPGSFLSEMCKAVLERGLQAELDAHLGHGKHDAAGRGSGNSRNGTTPKTVQTEIGPVPLAVPRDRAGSFTPMLVPNGGAPPRQPVGCDHQPVRGRDDGA
jgi:putative transposase